MKVILINGSAKKDLFQILPYNNSEASGIRT